MMTFDILLLLAGLVLVVLGADWLVDGASAVARKAGISEFVIGLTIVGFGTSCPELVVSMTGALQGNADVAIGNVVGSNIFNTLLILGLTAVIMPVSISPANTKRDIPVTLAATVSFIILALSRTLFGLGAADVISRTEGVIFLVLFAAYLFYCFKFDDGLSEDETEKKTMNIFVSILLIVAGLSALIFGGRLFVDHSVSLARSLGASDKLIAITLLAGGTSMPELVTCIVASLKHKDQLALGNILGSNVFNILLILGCASVVTPLSAANLKLTDAAAMLTGVVLLLIFAFTGKKQRIDRWEGCLMLAIEAAYVAFLFIND